MGAQFDVMVGNVGCVYSGDDFNAAGKAFCEYRDLSMQPGGRASLESVTMLADGEPRHEFEPERDMEAAELAKYHGVYGSCDFALPIGWHRRASELMEQNVSGHVGWNYPEGQLCGEPFGLTELGRAAVESMSRIG